MKDKIITENIEPLNDYNEFAEQQESNNKAEDAISQYLKNQELSRIQEEQPETIEDIAIEDDKSITDTAKAAGKDIAKGVFKEGPRAAVSGVAKGINEIAETIDDVAMWLDENVLNLPETEKKFKLPTPKFGNKTLTGEDDRQDSPTTVTGNLIEDVTQFLTGFGVANKALKATTGIAKAGRVTKTAVTGGVADVIAFDEQEARISDAVQSVPELQNIITESLQSDEDDTILEGKVKQFAEGAGLGVLGEGLAKTFTAIKKWKGGKQSIEAELETLPKKEKTEKEIATNLGDSKSNEFILNKLKLSAKETEGLTPEEAAKLSSKKPTTADEIEINFARINGSEDIKQAMQAFANEASLLPSVKKARRGVRSHEVTITAAQDVDGFKTLLERREGTPLNAEETLAARNFYGAAANKVMAMAQKAADPNRTMTDVYDFRKMVAVFHSTQKELLGARAEAGRSLNAWKIQSDLTPDEQLKGMEAIIDSFGGQEATVEMATKLSSFKDGALTTTQLNIITEKTAYARTRDALVEAWTAGLLTNPVTHAKNILSIVGNQLLSTFERYAGTMFSKDVSMGEANSYLMGILSSQKQALVNGGKAFRTGQIGFGQGKLEFPGGVEARATSKENLNLGGPLGKPFTYAMDYYGRIVNTSFRALAAGDEYGKTVFYNGQLTALSTNEGLSKGLKGDELREYIAQTLAAPSKNLQAQAREFANYQTFTNELGQEGKNIQRLINKNPTSKFIFPFVRTPINIFKYTYERTPLALLSQNIRKDISAGGRRQSDALIKIGTGSSIMAIASDLSINGNITGSGPSDFKLRKKLEDSGIRFNSIKIGDTFYSYQGLEPLSTLLSLSTGMTEILTNYESYDANEQDEIDNLATASILLAKDATINKTFLSGFSSALEAIIDPEGAGEFFVNRLLSSAVPAGVAATERATNPEQEYVFNLMDSFKARIPGFSKDVAKKRNTYGEVLQYRYPEESIIDKTTSGLVSLFNPFYSSKLKDDPFITYTIKNGLTVDMPRKKQEFKNRYGKNAVIDLKEYPKIYSRFLELRGQEIKLPSFKGKVKLKNSLEQLTKFPVFERLDNDLKQQKFNQITRKYQEFAKRQLIEEFPVINQLINESELSINNPNNL